MIHDGKGLTNRRAEWERLSPIREKDLMVQILKSCAWKFHFKSFQS